MTATADCVPLERLIAAELAAVDLAHVGACARCQTERAMAQAFDASDPLPDEGAAVAWIVNETRRRVFPETRPVAPIPSGAPRFLPRWATWASAAMAASLGVYLLVRTPATPSIEVEPGPVYRSMAVVAVAPVGDVAAVPAELRWQALSGAVGYTVGVLEVDGTEIWTTTTRDTVVALPDDVRAAAKPARTLRWRVDATDAAGNPIGDPATATFRVVP